MTASTPLVPAKAGTQADFPRSHDHRRMGPGFRRGERMVRDYV
jgi:hypothetical protein